VLLASCDEVLQHLVHGGHVEDNPQLGHAHSEETPQENGGTEALAEGDRL
jgi:hypothetical protein